MRREKAAAVLSNGLVVFGFGGAVIYEVADFLHREVFPVVPKDDRIPVVFHGNDFGAGVARVLEKFPAPSGTRVGLVGHLLV